MNKESFGINRLTIIAAIFFVIALVLFGVAQSMEQATATEVVKPNGAILYNPVEEYQILLEVRDAQESYEQFVEQTKEVQKQIDDDIARLAATPIPEADFHFNSHMNDVATHGHDFYVAVQNAPYDVLKYTLFNDGRWLNGGFTREQIAVYLQEDNVTYNDTYARIFLNKELYSAVIDDSDWATPLSYCHVHMFGPTTWTDPEGSREHLLMDWREVALHDYDILGSHDWTVVDGTPDSCVVFGVQEFTFGRTMRALHNDIPIAFFLTYEDRGDDVWKISHIEAWPYYNYQPHKDAADIKIPGGLKAPN